MQIYKIITVILVGLLPFATWAQRNYGTIHYTIGLPMGNTSDFISENSFRGLGLEYGYFLTSNLSVGGGVSWNVFNQEGGRVTQTINDVTYTGNQFKFMKALPVFVQPRYFFIAPNEGSFSGYTSLGIGTIFTRQTMDIGNTRFEAEDWQFALLPELGGIFRMRSGAGLNVNLRYNAGFKSSDLPATYYLGVNVGLVFMR